ncbi:unnamed protein product [Mytilus coruscus]|uniref:MEGF10_11 n=1 Tax=Mytilus coruscus TaxID=42192 RepID=A0A6J8C043_MYTCO|nr:unnamed protein product [Mytilus coruscus]
MVNKYICVVLLVVFTSIACSKKCDLKTKSGVIQQVCCADYEENKNDCVGKSLIIFTRLSSFEYMFKFTACSKGYRSRIGQHCMPCPKNTYGERCRYECSCARSEICDNVEGCVEYATTSDTSVHARSYCSIGYTSKQGQNCTSCPKNTYGERCKYDCSCSGFEICDNVKGCVGFPLSTDTPVYATSSCFKGYTSYIGQSCKPCSRNTFDERCRDECTCSGFEICDHVEGCVDLSSTTGTSVPATNFVDDRTYISTIS